MAEAPKYTNSLIHAQSPYLLQHAHNPVNWMEWNEEAWNKARTEDKPVLVSIGYASCHWCHVMEHESFENEDTAAIMNEYFICIKVDREERPDVDQIYMDAVQLINGSGGWPLNMFCLPDGRPIHGGTYFPNRNWNQLLFQLHDLYLNRKTEALAYAEKLKEGIVNMDVLRSDSQVYPDKHVLKEVISNWAKQFDWIHGGNARTPKFPLPVNFQFLLSAGLLFPESDALKMVRLTLDKMAFGGIYDQLAGGFSRYSVDKFWKVPHFEKMLYDNGQLISLYSRAAGVFSEPRYAEIARQCCAFLETECQAPNGLFYSSYDADSEGEEGAYYVWTWDELKALPESVFPLFTAYYTCEEQGNWEHGKNILHATMSVEDFAKLQGLDTQEVQKTLAAGKNVLREWRGKRIKPALDDKCILSWNALALEGYAEAARYLQDPYLLNKALKHAEALETFFLKEEQYYRIVKGTETRIPAFLEDLAALCSAYISLYQVCFEEKWLYRAREIADLVYRNFYDKNTGLFFFVSSDSEQLITRKKDLGDDVIPSGNSMMALNFMKLHHYFGDINYGEWADRMLGNMAESFKKHAPWYSHWGQAYLMKAFGLYQLCAGGPGAVAALADKQLFPHPNLILASSVSPSALPLLHQRVGKELKFFMCKDETCYAPEATLSSSLALKKTNPGSIE
ncbi:MAG: thioredoxin domain-containing protein [Bacteroidia bacterium]